MDLIISGCIYLFVILSTVFCTWKAESKLKISKANKHGYSLNCGYIYIILALLIPSVLAGIRADEVGTDVSVYAVQLMREAVASKSFYHMNMIDTTYTEYGYRFLAFLISRVFVDVGWLLFFTEVITMSIVIYSAYMLRFRVSMVKFMAVYLCLFYHVSFNIMRQSLAMSFILLFFCYLIYSKYYKAAICAVVGFGVHTFSLYVVGIIVILYIGEKLYRKIWQKMFSIGFIMILVMFFQAAQPLIISILGIGGERYLRYFQNIETGSVFDILTSPSFLIKVILFMFTTYTLSRNKSFIRENDVLFLCCLLSLMFTIMQAKIGIAYRLGEYLGVFFCIYLPDMFNYKSLIKKRQVTSVFYFTLIGYWLFSCMLSAYSSTAILTFRI